MTATGDFDWPNIILECIARSYPVTAASGDQEGEH